MPLYKQTEAFNKCLTKVIYPTGNAKLQDGDATSGVENYKEFWYSLVGLAGIGQNFDGNGAFTQFLVGNSGQTLVSKPTTLVGHDDVGHGRKAADALAAVAARDAARLPGRSPPTSRWCPATRRRRRNSTAPLANGPADGS